MRRKTQRNIIMTGLTGTMAGMVATGFAGSKKSHIAVSAAFVGFTAWHFVFTSPFMRRRKTARKNPS